jgi:hypothetical protein
MLISCPDLLPHRFAAIPRWYWITIQVVNPGSIRVGTNQLEVSIISGSAADGLEVLPGKDWSGWWYGDLWYIAETPNSQFRIIIPGFQGGVST